MFRKLAMLAAILLASAAFVWANYPSAIVTVMVGPNSVMHTKALPNDGADHKPYLQWSGTADSDVISADTIIIRKGWIVKGLWGGRRATSTRSGHLLVSLTSINGVNVGGDDWKDNFVRGQDSWVAAGRLIQFITCTPGVLCPALQIPNP